MERKNILLIINQLHGGGAQKVMASLSLYLEPFYTVHFVIYNDVDKIDYHFGGNLIRMKVPFAENTYHNSTCKRAIRFISLIRQLRAIKKKHQIDVSISFMDASNIINMLSARKEKTLISVRSFLTGEMNELPRMNIFRQFIKHLYNRADAVIVPSGVMRDDLIDNFRVARGKINIIHNFMSSADISRQAIEGLPEHLTGVFSKHEVIINVGRLTKAKNQHALLVAFGQFWRKNPLSRLVILGDGPLRDDLVQTARAEGLTVYIEDISLKHNVDEHHQVFFLGNVANPYLYLSKSFLFIMTSVYEGFPNALIEAMCCGLPVISTDCPSGPREIISPDSELHSSATNIEPGTYGLLIPRYTISGGNLDRHIQNIVTSLQYFFSSAEQREHYSRQSKKRAEDFEATAIIDQWKRQIER